MTRRKTFDKLLAIAAGALAVPATAQTYGPPHLTGVWSLGEKSNCESGPAWVFLADGYYAEVTLPDKGPSATGLWKDEGKTVAYTHSHMPYKDMMAPNEFKRLTVEERTADKLTTRNYGGIPRIFHRCPNDALRANAAQADH